MKTIQVSCDVEDDEYEALQWLAGWLGISIESHLGSFLKEIVTTEIATARETKEMEDADVPDSSTE